MIIGRRQFLKGSAAFLAAPSYAATDTESKSNTLFGANLASGDPTATSVVLWTKLQNATANQEIRWQVSTEVSFLSIAQEGVGATDWQDDFCFHAIAEGLQPATTYYYRFLAGDQQSQIGRTKTLPAPGTLPAEFSIALVSCQDFSTGYFTAYADILERDPDLILHVGDYIYETPGSDARPYPFNESLTLQDYRQLYALYRSDPFLQAAHAQHPWIFTWDDHEVLNDWGPEHYILSSYNHEMPADRYPARKAAAVQAYFENMPIRPQRPEEYRLFEQVNIGDLVELNKLDVRSYRSTPACELNERNHFEPCPEANEESRTLLGKSQEDWLARHLGQSQAAWTMLAQATVMAPLDLAAGESTRYEADGWDNYANSRLALSAIVDASGIENVISLGGNIHAFLLGTFGEHVTEIITTSVSANGGDESRYQDIQRRLAENPTIEFFDNRYRGYTWLDITPDRIHVDLRGTDDIRDPHKSFETLGEFNISPTVAGTTSI